ncbi:MAG TPA: nucleotide exchange factor GrpE [Gemmatimonadales bacterium]|nr:nucleotide exchange factor GrpE [Gemmatimonadales bacterium]
MKKHPSPKPDPATPGPQPGEARDPGLAPEVSPDAPGGAVLELPDEAVARLETELAAAKDKHLRLAAEFDNFRKRTARERADAWARAQADLVARLVDALDDLARFAHVDPASTDAKTIHDGVDMVERKVWKQLEASGVTRVDQTGVPFDPHLHEAVTTQPAPSAERDHTVAAILQAGYKLGDALIRPARVAVFTWKDEGRGTEDA